MRIHLIVSWLEFSLLQEARALRFVKTVLGQVLAWAQKPDKPKLFLFQSLSML